jgi:TfoX/Sxy family transcriptional regulator of competence genes
MAWVKVPPEHHPIFIDALPKDPRVERMKMFGGIAAKVNGHIFAGLFGRSTIVQLPEPDRAEALALEGAGPFDPMGNGRVMSEKVMLPESMMADEEELRAWVSRAFQAALVLPPKAPKPPKAAKAKAAKAPKPSATKAAPPKAKAKPKAKAVAKKAAAPAKKRPAAKTRARRR